MIQLQRQTISSAFEAVGLRPVMMPLGHVLNVDHFHMSQPTFPPHPHAGFSAVTWMLPWSQGGFINRDSLGDRSRITPGALHWTLAGAGMLHEEIPEAPGVDCEGLQIFVKLPEAEELSPPRAFHVQASEVPTLEAPGVRVRVLVGDVEGVRGMAPSHAHTTLAHVSVSGRWTASIPEGVDAFVMVLRGGGTIGREGVEVHQALPLAQGPVGFEGEGLELLLGWSARMPQPPTFDGPFCMFRRARLEEAHRRFRAGEMGALAPSPVGWHRPGSGRPERP